jgi:AcrR family transcriptional regulator
VIKRLAALLIYNQEHMPATRPHIDRERKRDEILDAAEPLLLRDGYDGTAMAEVARAAGVANNAVYWYFPSKDDLLAAVLARRQERALAELPASGQESVDGRILSLLAQLDQVANLTAAVHERSRHSATVAKVHDAFHRSADELLSSLLRDAGLDTNDAARGAKAVMALVEGIHLHSPDRDTQSRDELVLWTIHRLAAGG